MGLFSTKKKVYVSSTVYKIVDDGTEQKSFMRELVATTALSNTANTSFAEALVATLQNGPRSRQKSFFRWAKNNFDFGLPRAAIDYTAVINDAAMEAQIHTAVFAGNADINVVLNEAFLDNADESYYAEEWLYANRPELALLDWAADVDPDTNDIWIQYPPGTEYLGNPITNDSFNVPGFNSSNNVIVAYYQYETISTGVISPAQAYVYLIGSGNATLDNYRVELTDGASAREFYPFIPLRVDNKSVFDAAAITKPKEEIIRKAWDKALGSDIQDAIDEINSNPDVNEIDYAYMVQGVCLNTDSPFEQQYLFEFFRGLVGSQGYGGSEYSSYTAANDALGYHARTLANTFEELNTAAANDPSNPGFLTGVSPASQSRAPRITNIHLTLPTAELGVLDMRISWSDISEETKPGVMYHGARVGDIQIGRSTTFGQRVELPFMFGDFYSMSNVSGIVIRKQISLNEYVEVTCRGLLHKNLIYKGKSVDITAEEALSDPDDSGFVIPLHEPTLRRLGGVRATEIAKESYVIIFNSYKVVKKKWYQSGIFKFILAVVIVVIAVVLTVVFAPAGSAAASGGYGLLGANAAIGASLGFTGLMAIAIGAAVNAIAAAIVIQLVGKVSTAVLGEQIGRIITMVSAALIALGSGPGGFGFGNISSNIGNMAAIDKLAMMTNAAADIVGIFTQGQLDEIMAAAKKATEDYDAQLKEIETLMEQFSNTGLIDPMMFTDFTNPLDAIKLMGENFAMPPTFGEQPEDFIRRTLMTSSDLIELSNAMVTEFVDATLTLP